MSLLVSIKLVSQVRIGVWSTLKTSLAFRKSVSRSFFSSQDASIISTLYKSISPLQRHLPSMFAGCLNDPACGITPALVSSSWCLWLCQCVRVTVGWACRAGKWSLWHSLIAPPLLRDIAMNDLGFSKHHLSPRYRPVSGHQLIKLLRLTRLAVMSSISSVSSDQRFDHARD
jgi:hypothetical protein